MKTDLSIRARIYLRAAELVEQGHCKDVLWELNEAQEKIAYCYRGALIEAEMEISPLSPISGWREWMGWRESDEIVDWNNDPKTTGAEVAAKLRSQAFAEEA